MLHFAKVVFIVPFGKCCILSCRISGIYSAFSRMMHFMLHNKLYFILPFKASWILSCIISCMLPCVMTTHALYHASPKSSFARSTLVLDVVPWNRGEGHFPFPFALMRRLVRASVLLWLLPGAGHLPWYFFGSLKLSSLEHWTGLWSFVTQPPAKGSE